MEALEASTALLLPLAHACPKLVELHLPGAVGPDLLRTFGSLCPNLSCLHATLELLPQDTLSQLSTLLPCLTSLTALQKTYPGHPWEPNASVAATCIALKACTKLLSFDQTPCAMSEKVWAALPESLASCTTAGVTIDRHSVPEVGMFLPHGWSLQHMHLRTLKISLANLSLQGLSILLSGSPSLASIVVDTHMMCFSNAFADHLEDELSVFSTRLLNGLQILTLDEHHNLTPSKVCLQLNLSDPQVCSLLTAGKPPSLAGMTQLEFCCHKHPYRVNLLQLPRVFPCMRELKISDTEMNGADLLIVGSCPDLTDLILQECGGVTCVGLAAMCDVSHSLKRLSCYKCDGISTAEGQAMQQEEWGGTVHVYVAAVRLQLMWPNF